MVNAWYMSDDSKVTSQFERNYESSIDAQVIKNELGVDSYKVSLSRNTNHNKNKREMNKKMWHDQVDVDNLATDETFVELKKSMGITYQDEVVISPKTFANNYDEKVNQQQQPR